MAIFRKITVLVIMSVCVHCYELNQSNKETTSTTNDIEIITLSSDQINQNSEIEKVTVDVYYESLCPICIHFFVHKLEPEIPTLHQYLDIRLYPYGNAYTNNVGDHYEITCQHGESECYGNKLHACAIDILKNVTKSTLFNSCLSDWYSNDEGVEECAKWLKFDGTPIKECAKSDKGQQLLKYYGDESNKIYYPGVPHVRINGIYSSWRNFKKNVCLTFKHPPPSCDNVTD